MPVISGVSCSACQLAVGDSAATAQWCAHIRCQKVYLKPQLLQNLAVACTLRSLLDFTPPSMSGAAYRGATRSAILAANAALSDDNYCVLVCVGIAAPMRAESTRLPRNPNDGQTTPLCMQDSQRYNSILSTARNSLAEQQQVRGSHASLSGQGCHRTINLVPARMPAQELGRQLLESLEYDKRHAAQERRYLQSNAPPPWTLQFMLSPYNDDCLAHDPNSEMYRVLQTRLGRRGGFGLSPAACDMAAWQGAVLDTQAAAPTTFQPTPPLFATGAAAAAWALAVPVQQQAQGRRTWALEVSDPRQPLPLQAGDTAAPPRLQQEPAVLPSVFSFRKVTPPTFPQPTSLLIPSAPQQDQLAETPKSSQPAVEDSEEPAKVGPFSPMPPGTPAGREAGMARVAQACRLRPIVYRPVSPTGPAQSSPHGSNERASLPALTIPQHRGYTTGASSQHDKSGVLLPSLSAPDVANKVQASGAADEACPSHLPPDADCGEQPTLKRATRRTGLWR